MSSVRVIAKRAGVSITTVSRVLNNHPQVSSGVRERVLAATNESGYSPVVGRRSANNIAFVYTGEESIGSPFDAAVLHGVSRGLAEDGYDLMILSARRARLSHETFTQMFMRKGIRGALLRTTAEARPVCEAIASEGYPVVVIADRFENSSINCVYCDSLNTSREAVAHLIGQGHKRIAIGLHIITDSDHVDRLAGYRQALSDHALPFDSNLVLRAPAERSGGTQILRRLMTMPDRPTAIFITDPMTVVGLLSEARRMGVRIPEDLAVVGFDDAELRFGVYPELTAVCQDASALGFEAFRLLKTLIDRADAPDASRPDPTCKALRTWLEVHESAGPAPRLSQP